MTGGAMRPRPWTPEHPACVKCQRLSGGWLCELCVEAIITEGALEALREWYASRPAMRWRP